MAETTRTRRPILAFEILRRGTANFVDDRASQLAAGISYFALFSLFPFLLLVFSVIGLVLRDSALQQDVLESLVDALPVEGTSVEGALGNLAEGGATIGIFALLGTIWSASALATALRSALNVAFEVEERRPFVRGKLIDLTILPALGTLFLASLVLSGAWRIAQTHAGAFGIADEPSLQPLWELGALVIPGVITFLGFLFLYWLLPNRALHPRHLWPGALVATLGFELVKFGFTLYVANFANYDVVYGSLGGVIVLLFWVYLSANIMLFGAEVAAEVPHVLLGEARHGHVGAPDVGWRSSLWTIVRSFVLGPVDSEDETHPHEEAAHPEQAGPDEETR